jgi:hypothetical protein
MRCFPAGNNFFQSFQIGRYFLNSNKVKMTDKLSATVLPCHGFVEVDDNKA